ncbi:MAG TPA: hypothetical protein VFN50_07015 [Acidimicrobiales bacterium]|nr:hypothetical protein [Acidimicrobiales bacterium]
MHLTRRRLQQILGAFWLLDGVLQLQPFMFTRGFAERVLGPAAVGQPAFVAVPVRLSAQLVASHHVLADAVFAAVQLAIGAGLFVRPLVTAALAGSVAWGLGVWYLGEGLGGLAGGRTSLLVGAPGAALLYVALALVAWPEREPSGAPGRRSLRVLFRPGRSDVTARRGTVGLWAGIWLTGAVLSVLPAQARPGGIAAAVSWGSSGGPAWLVSLGHLTASILGREGGGVAAGMAALEVLVALLALRPGWTRVAAGLGGGALALADWLLGQGMGQLTTGQATDPNAGIVLVVLAVALVSLRRPPQDDSARAGRPGLAPAVDARRVA